MHSRGTREEAGSRSNGLLRRRLVHVASVNVYALLNIVKRDLVFYAMVCNILLQYTVIHFIIKLNFSTNASLGSHIVAETVFEHKESLKWLVDTNRNN